MGNFAGYERSVHFISAASKAGSIHLCKLSMTSARSAQSCPAGVESCFE